MSEVISAVRGEAWSTRERVTRSRCKRAIDILGASVLLFIFTPVLLLIALAIRVEDGGPALFRQRRTGLHGAPFTILKFRSMSVAEELDVRQATRNDRRVTRVGAVLRQLSLDELPQLLNVLRGDMSLVGPRPHALQHDAAWSAEISGYTRRFRAKPGLTGYAQVSGLRGEARNIDQIVARVEADNYYIDNWSLRLELGILLRTAPLVFNDPRAY